MYRNRFRIRNIGLFAAAALHLLCTFSLIGCAKSTRRTELSDSEIDDSDNRTGDSAVKDATFLYPSTPQEIKDELAPLFEPDFIKPLEELATESCGYLFTAESVVDSQKESYTILETRAFDAEGRLIAAEIQFLQSTVFFSEPPLLLNRRLQIDYDPSGRPVLVRLGPMFDATTTESKGSVIRFEYQSNGSSRSRYVTNETEQIAKSTDPFGCGFASSTVQPYFCEELRFDSNNNLLDRTWDCINPTVVQSRSYDDQARVISDRGSFLYESDNGRPIPIPRNWLGGIQMGEWQIGYQYDDAIDSNTITWKTNLVDSPDYYHCSRRFGLQPQDELEDGVENRLVRTFDETGQRPLIIDYDYGNDGDLDEQVTYTYQDGDLSSKEVDLFRDGIVDIVEIHNRSPNSHRVERRSMTSPVVSVRSGDINDFKASFVRPSATLPPQSQAVTEFRFDDRSRPIETDLEIQWLYTYLPYESSVQEQALVSESWHQTSQYADQGYVKENKVVWEPSDALLQVQASDSYRDQSLGSTPELFESFANTTTCSITPLCEHGEITLPQDTRLLRCEVAFIFPEYQNTVDTPSIPDDDDIFVVPPYDSLPGVKNLLKRITGGAKRLAGSDAIYGFPFPPNVRDMVDY